MPFTVKEFPDQLFKTIEEYEEAKQRRRKVENSIAERSEEIAQVTAVVIPASKELLERKIVGLERKILDLTSKVTQLSIESAETPIKKKTNHEGLQIGTILQGGSRGRKYTLEVLDKGYLCSNGTIYQSLSGAALGVSENRRSGWKFWKDIEGNSIGETTGRFKGDRSRNPFRTDTVS